MNWTSDLTRALPTPALARRPRHPRAVGLIGLLSLALLLVPFIPGVGALPRLIPIHRLVWRDYSAKRGARPGRRTGPTNGRTRTR